MRKEENYYLEILRDFTNGNKTVKQDDLDWNLLIEIAKSQNTNGIVYYQCKDFIPQPFNGVLMNLYMAEIYSYGKRVKFNRDIKAKFEENDINYFLVKGPIVAEYYPIPALRTMGDSDFIVNKQDDEKACALLEELGFKCESAFNEKGFFKDSMEVELHNHLLYEDDGNNDELINYFNQAFEHVDNHVLDINFHFIFLLLHIRKHIVNRGIGYRFFMDLAMIFKKETLDWNYINNELKQVGMLDFKNVCLSLINEWFNVKGEDNLISLDPKFIEEASLKIMNNGVHGFNDEENNNNVAYQAISEGNTSKIKYFINRYFRSYDLLIKDQNYKFLIGKKHLLPVAWVYRFYLSIRDNKALKEIKKSFKGVTASKDDLDKRNDELHKWGL